MQPDFSKMIAPTYTGPRIRHYVGASWSMHLPFAYDLMRELNPGLFVELGVWKGESYFTFCQSVADHGLATQCRGIDTWAGDIHLGVLPPEIGRAVAAYNVRYESFSQLKKMRFEEARADFPDGSIDLLHIDGGHRYEDVQVDFETWLPKVRPGGIILFHDVTVRDESFGVWKLWEEISGKGRSFLFEFGHGLGVWEKSGGATNDAPLLCRLFEAGAVERNHIQEEYQKAACALALWERARVPSEDNYPVPGNPEPVFQYRTSTTVQIFGDRGEGYAQDLSSMQEIPYGTWLTLNFERLEEIHAGSGRQLRLDPADGTAIIEISKIEIGCAATGHVLHLSDATAGFGGFKLSDGLLSRVSERGHLVIFSTDEDPRLFLPLPEMRTGCSYRLEIRLKVEPCGVNLIENFSRYLRAE